MGESCAGRASNPGHLGCPRRSALGCSIGQVLVDWDLYEVKPLIPNPRAS